MQSIISYVVGIVLLLVAGFGIYNILDIMILKATGFSGNDVKLIVITLSISIGFAGGIFGIIFECIFTSLIDVISFETASLPTVKTYSINFNVLYYNIGIVFALFTTILVGLFPTLKSSTVDPVKFQVLKEINMSINHEEFVSIVGKSVCVKSTLLYLLSTMDTDYEGKLFIHKELITCKLDKELAKISNENIGFVFQFHYLISDFNILKNMILPGMKLAKYSKKEIEHCAMEYLKKLDMQNLALKMANQRGGGQKHRIAIARALINNPLLTMGDEPTGNLHIKKTTIWFLIFSINLHKKAIKPY